ncbi:MAG: amidohydrolase [Geminicoccaceae bacterium]|nr:amidohydrolase [Geminicoccaceae bacterium]
MAIENWVAQHVDELTEFRRDLHRNPELLYDVERTAARVAEALEAAGCDEVHRGIGRTGVVGVIRGQQSTSGRAIGLRADMDALPIVETSDKPWSSTIPGKMHACGHDGHTTMLLGAAKGLAESRGFDGTVYLFFQPAEEGGAGAKAMIDDGLFERFPVDEVYGIHNKPGLPIGQFAVPPKAVMGSVDEITITIEGKGGHAAFPHLTTDPIVVTSALVQAVQSIVSRTVDPRQSAVVSITTIHAGDAFNVIAPAVRLNGTVRTLDEEVRNDVERRLQRMVEHIAEAFEARGTLDYVRHYPPTVNHPEQASHAVEAAVTVAGAERVDPDYDSSMGGEDFAFMLLEKPGAFLFVGNGDTPACHHPAYDFDDEAIAWGCSFWTTLVRQRLPIGEGARKAA